MQRPVCCLTVTRALCILIGLAPLFLRADTLADIYELALKNDAQLKAAEASYKAGRESKVQGRSALLPSVVATGEYASTDIDTESIQTQFDEVNQEFFPFPLTANNDTDKKGYSISLQQNLFNLPAWFSFKQGKELSKQAKAQFSADQQALIVRVAEAYFNVLRAADNLQTADAEVEALQRQLEQTQQRFEVGLIAITEVHEARAVYDSAVVTQLEADGQLGISYEALTVLTGEPHSNLWQLDEKFPITKPAPAKRADWVDFALQNNFLLRASRYAAEASHQNAKSKKSEHLPKLTGSYTYQDNTEDGDTNVKNIGQVFPVDTKTDGNTLSLNLELPLYTGGFTSSTRRQAYQEYIQARETAINTQRNTVQGTRSLHLTVVTDVGKVKARDLAITSSQSALDATQAGYEVGTRNIVDVLESQRFLYRALFDYSNARYDYVINMLKLKEQAGILSPEDIYTLNKWLQQPKPASAKKQPSSN